MFVISKNIFVIKANKQNTYLNAISYFFIKLFTLKIPYAYLKSFNSKRKRKVLLFVTLIALKAIL